MKRKSYRFPKGSLLVFTLLLLLSSSPIVAQIQRVDLGVLVEMMEHRKEEPTEFWQQISNSTNVVSMLVPISILATGYARGERTTIQKGWFMAESLITSSLVTMGLKYTLKRNRPFNTDSYIVP